MIPVDENDGKVENKKKEEQEKEEQGGELNSLFDEQNHKTEPLQPRLKTSELVVRRIYLLGRIISRIFKDNNLPYWVTGGTLLGCVRHKGLIPWDDDIDISVMETHEQNLVQMKDVLENNQLLLTNTFFGYRIHHKTESIPLSETSHHGLPFCDVTIMRHNIKKGKIELKHQSARDLWEKEFYLPEEVELFQEMIYGDFTFSAPMDPLPYLFRYYGDDVLKTGWSQNYDHEARLPVTSVVIDTQNGFEPARPFR